MKKNNIYTYFGLFYFFLIIYKLPAQDRASLNEWGLQNLYMYLNQRHFEVNLKNGEKIKIDTLAGGFVWAKPFIDDIIITNKRFFLLYHNVYYKNKTDYRSLSDKDTIDLAAYTQHQLLAKKDTFYFAVEMDYMQLNNNKKIVIYHVFNAYPVQKQFIEKKESVIFTIDSLKKQIETYSIENFEITNFSIRNRQYQKIVPIDCLKDSYIGLKHKKRKDKIILSLKESIVISFSPCPWCSTNSVNKDNQWTYFYKKKQWHTPIMYPNRVYW